MNKQQKDDKILRNILELENFAKDAFVHVFNNCESGIIITDWNGKILYVNHAFTCITGYECEEVIGNNPSILHSDYQDKKFYNDLWNEIKEGRGYFSSKIWNRRKSGEAYPEVISIQRIEPKGVENGMFIAVFSEISTMDAAKLSYVSYYDNLTKFANRMSLIEHLEIVVQNINSRTSNKEYLKKPDRIAILCFNLDNFKLINNQHGYFSGDKVLIEVGQRVFAFTRSTDLLARLGGDEFVLVTHVNTKEEALLVGNKIHEVICKPFYIKEKELNISVSVGISIYPLDEYHPDKLINFADQAMYEAKKTKGQEPVKIYSDLKK